MKQMKNKWIVIDEFKKKYIQEDYVPVHIGKHYVDLDDIISLEIPYEELIESDKVDKLTKMYLNEGIFHYMPNLLKSPNGKYSADFGSELILVAKRVGVEKIEARIEVAVPNSYLTGEDKKMIDIVSTDIEAINEALSICKRNRVDNDIDLNIQHPFFFTGVKRFLDLGEIHSEAVEDLQNYYRRVAIREGLMLESDWKFPKCEL